MMEDRDIFIALDSGVDASIWERHVDELRVRGYSVFDMARADRTDFEIVSPDCVKSWQVGSGRDGQLRIRFCS